MAKIREIRRRIKSVESTRQITRTMEMIAATKIKKAQARIEAARPYALKMMDVLYNVARFAPEVDHPLLAIHEPVEKVIVVPITSNRGLCGGFNTGVVKRTEGLFKNLQDQGKSCSLIGVGRKGLSMLRFAGYPISASYTELSDQPSFIEAQTIARELARLYTERQADEVYLVFNQFKSLLQQKPVDHLLLPIRRDQAVAEPTRTAQVEYVFEPSAGEVLVRLLPTYVETIVYRALLESTASEHAARRMAMKRATDNAGEVIDNLVRSFNKARQAQITQEIAEIVGGAAGLAK